MTVENCGEKMCDERNFSGVYLVGSGKAVEKCSGQLHKQGSFQPRFFLSALNARNVPRQHTNDDHFLPKGIIREDELGRAVYEHLISLLSYVATFEGLLDLIQQMIEAAIAHAHGNMPLSLQLLVRNWFGVGDW